MVKPALWIVFALATPQESVVNPLFDSLVGRGVESHGVKVTLPRPSLADGQDAAASRAVLKEIAGDERSVENFLRDSVTAPFILRTKDIKDGDSTIRIADLWFVVRGNLADIDLKRVLGQTDTATVEAGNMRLTTKILTDQDLGDRKLDRLPVMSGRDEWYSHATGRLLDRIGVAVTNHAIATRTADSLTVASSTSRSFDGDARYPNQWQTIVRTGNSEKLGNPQTYEGAGSYAKITRLAAESGTLLVEAHFAFVEPQPWFGGNPILRSKLSLICQDQVRQLRRETQKRREPK